MSDCLSCLKGSGVMCWDFGVWRNDCESACLGLMVQVSGALRLFALTLHSTHVGFRVWIKGLGIWVWMLRSWIYLQPGAVALFPKLTRNLSLKP